MSFTSLETYLFSRANAWIYYKEIQVRRIEKSQVKSKIAIFRDTPILSKTLCCILPLHVVSFYLL